MKQVESSQRKTTVVKHKPDELEKQGVLSILEVTEQLKQEEKSLSSQTMFEHPNMLESNGGSSSSSGTLGDQNEQVEQS